MTVRRNRAEARRRRKLCPHLFQAFYDCYPIFIYLNSPIFCWTFLKLASLHYQLH